MFKGEDLAIDHINVIDDDGNIILANLQGVNIDTNSDDIAHRFDFTSEASLIGNNSKVYYKFKGDNK